MLIDADIIELGTIDKSKIKSAVETALITNWLDKNFDRHEESLVAGRLCTLPFPIRNVNLEYTDEQITLIKSVMPIVEDIKSYFPDYKPVRGEIVNLLPKRQLTLHKDIYWFHKHSKRIHVPLYTNSKCYQIFEDRQYKLKQGRIYEINNRIMHSASNQSSKCRIHLILDLMHKNKFEELKNNHGLAMRIENEA